MQNTQFSGGISPSSDRTTSISTYIRKAPEVYFPKAFTECNSGFSRGRYVRFRNGARSCQEFPSGGRCQVRPLTATLAATFSASEWTVKLAPLPGHPLTANLPATFRFQLSEGSVLKPFQKGILVLSCPDRALTFPTYLYTIFSPLLTRTTSHQKEETHSSPYSSSSPNQEREKLPSSHGGSPPWEAHHHHFLHILHHIWE